MIWAFVRLSRMPHLTYCTVSQSLLIECPLGWLTRYHSWYHQLLRLLWQSHTYSKSSGTDASFIQAKVGEGCIQRLQV